MRKRVAEEDLEDFSYKRPTVPEEARRLVCVRYVHDGVVYSISQRPGEKGHYADFFALSVETDVSREWESGAQVAAHKREAIECWLEDGRPYRVG